MYSDLSLGIDGLTYNFDTCLEVGFRSVRAGKLHHLPLVYFACIFFKQDQLHVHVLAAHQRNCLGCWGKKLSWHNQYLFYKASNR